MSFLDTAVIQQLNCFTPELIFFDVDGTLLNTQGHYTEKLKQELERLSHNGVKLAIASGRPAIAAQFLFNELPVTDAGLFCTGAEIYNPKQQRHINIHHLDLDLVKTLYQYSQKSGLYFELYTTDFYTAGHDKDISDIHSQHLRVQPKKINPEKIISENIPVTKLLLGAKRINSDNVLESLSRDFPQCEFAFAHFLARPDWCFASVISKSADKKMGFDQLLKYHNVKAQNVMAFGDSHSDKVFLQEAGMGVAMSNAVEDVKANANIVTLSSDNNGVAEALSHI